MKSIINSQELALLLKDKPLVLIDARTGSDAKAKYELRHLEGALYVDLETDLADKKTNPAEGGRHPLPDIKNFAELLGQLGIQPESHVVVYDDKNGANAASRFWWMLRAMGHRQVQVLDGGYSAAVVAGVPTSSKTGVSAKHPPYKYKSWQLPAANIEEVERAGRNSAYLVIDVRDAERFRGEKEPIDLVAGHIPGAVNIPFTTNLDQNGFFLPAGQLYAKYEETLGGRKPENVMVHCGSGVTACHTLLALDYAGIPIPKLSVGSWSEWSRSGKPLATGA